RGDVIRDRPLAEVENEVLTVAELDQDRGVHLTRTDERCGSHEDDAHLVGLDVFGARKPVRGALQPWLGCDALVQEPFLPAPHGNAAEEGCADVLLGTGLLLRRGDGEASECHQRESERGGENASSGRVFHPWGSPWDINVS